MTLASGNRHALAIVSSIAMCNMRHAFFNIIPVYPLDGAKVLSALRNPNQVITMVNNQMFYQIILILLTLYGLTSRIIDPVCRLIINIIGGLF
jgi:Zn-dependent protease